MIHSDTVTTPDFDTDKCTSGYRELYLERVHRPRRVLEVGVQSGGSLLLWCDLWPTVECVVGIDVAPPTGPLNSRIRFYAVDQRDAARLDEIARATGPFDLIVDDASHIGEWSWATFQALWPHVAPGGIYAVEDWGTGYWSDWPDGVGYTPSPPPGHVAGMVGLIKRLVDELDHGVMARLELLPGLAFAYKSAEPAPDAAHGV